MPRKNVTTGEGGMVTTDNADIADRLRVLALHGMDKTAYDRYSRGGKVGYDVHEPGWKYNMPDTASSLGIEGLKRVESRLIRRAEVWDRYVSELEILPGLTLPSTPDPESRHARHLFIIAIDPVHAGIDRDQMVEYLTADNIGTGIHYTPVHSFDYYRTKYRIEDKDLPEQVVWGNRYSPCP